MTVAGLLLLLCTAHAQEIREFMDLQTHTCMHVPYRFFGEGLTWFAEGEPPELSYKHQLTNVNYANYLAGNKGARIIVNGAICPEVIVSRKKARRIILEQLRQVNAFAQKHSDRFVVAKTPQQVRDYVHRTDKTIIIHSIEGGKQLLDSPEDAAFWAQQGVAFITLVHLIDDQFGGAAIRPGLATHLINYKGTIKRAFGKKRSKGLTDKGRQAILWLANAGIMTDLTHMSPQTRKEALAFMEAQRIPPLVTHDLFRPIQNHPRGIAEADILRIYQLDGLLSLPISGESLIAYRPRADYAARLDTLKAHCPGSIDAYKFTYQALQQLLEANLPALTGNSTAKWEDLPEQAKVRLAIGFQSDFNGWVNHSRPRYGEEGCYPINPEQEYEPVDLQGLAHPGLLESHWRLLKKEGVDLAPILRASERFLQLWAHFLENKGRFEMAGSSLTAPPSPIDSASARPTGN